MLELGETAAELHRQLGEAAAQSGVDRLYAYGDLAAEILKGGQAAGLCAASCFQGSHREIAADLNTWLQADDCLLVKGSRGMEMETVIALLEKALTGESSK
jgi:UDP-N-acetylmuramyl pentapeptide synthase